MNIAIDGPSGAGKSTIAKLLAKRLNILYLDTGAMYRAVGLKVHNLGIDASSEKEVAQILGDLKLEIKLEDGEQKIILDGVDVSKNIRQHHISKLASDVSALPPVRLKLVDMQRQIAKDGDVVLDGRDIGTFVLPNAEYKFYLTASVEVRAKRRYEELLNKGEKVDLTVIQNDIAQRDYNDANRDLAPLKKADDAIEIDSSNLSIEQVVNLIMTHISRE